MAPKGKQAARSSGKVEKKRAEKDAEETDGSQGDGSVLDLFKTLALKSCLAQVAPKVPCLLKDEVKATNGKAETNGTTEEAEANGNDETKDEAQNGNATHAIPDGPDEVFASLQNQLVWHNGLGLEASTDASLQAWLAMKGLELDWGPRAKRRGSPGVERITTNVRHMLPQYAHILMALMMLRAFLFRSYFACLPWLFFYQFASLLIPFKNLEKVPQVPLDKVPVKFRVVGTICIHALVWLFFVYELLWRTYFFEKIPLIGFVAYHAYAVRPADAWSK